MLAAKLNFDDPRPYLSLANLWYDQKKYEAAARMYRQATERMSPKKPLGLGKMLGSISSAATTGDRSTLSSLSESAVAHAYLGNALLKAGMFAEAETELRSATTENSVVCIAGLQPLSTEEVYGGTSGAETSGLFGDE